MTDLPKQYAWLEAEPGPRTPDTIATIIGLVTPVLVWAIPNKKVA